MPRSSRETFAERLARLLREHGIDPTRSAVIMGVREGTVYKLLRGDSKMPEVPAFLRIAHALGVSPYELAGLEEPPASRPPVKGETGTESLSPDDRRVLEQILARGPELLRRLDALESQGEKPGDRSRRKGARSA